MPIADTINTKTSGAIASDVGVPVDAKNSTAAVTDAKNASADTKNDTSTNTNATVPALTLETEKDSQDDGFNIQTLELVFDAVAKFCILCCCETFARTLFKNDTMVFGTKLGASQFVAKVTTEKHISKKLSPSITGNMVFITAPDNSHSGIVLRENTGLLCMDSNCTKPLCIRPCLSTESRILCVMAGYGAAPEDVQAATCADFKEKVTRAAIKSKGIPVGIAKALIAKINASVDIPSFITDRDISTDATAAGDADSESGDDAKVFSRHDEDAEDDGSESDDNANAQTETKDESESDASAQTETKPAEVPSTVDADSTSGIARDLLSATARASASRT